MPYHCYTCNKIHMTGNLCPVRKNNLKQEEECFKLWSFIHFEMIRQKIYGSMIYLNVEIDKEDIDEELIGIYNQLLAVLKGWTD